MLAEMFSLHKMCCNPRNKLKLWSLCGNFCTQLKYLNWCCFKKRRWKITQDNLSLSIFRIFHDPLDESVFRVREMLCYHLVKSFSQTRMNWPQNTWWVFEVLCWPEGSITAVVTTGKYNIILFSSKIPIILHLTVVVTTSWNVELLNL